MLPLVATARPWTEPIRAQGVLLKALRGLRCLLWHGLLLALDDGEEGRPFRPNRVRTCTAHDDAIFCDWCDPFHNLGHVRVPSLPRYTA